MIQKIQYLIVFNSYLITHQITMQDQQPSEREVLRNKLRQIVETRRIEDQNLERRSIKRERLSLQPIHPFIQNREGQKILFRLKKRREVIKTCAEDQYEVFNDSMLTRSKYKSPVNSIKNMQSSLMSKKVQSMMASINRSTKIQNKQKKERRSQVQLIRSSKKKINNRKVCAIWAERSEVMVRRYGQQLQQFQRQLQDRYVSDRITNMKASSDLSLAKLDKEYKEHQLMVHLREQFKVVSQKHRRRKSQR